MVPERSEVGIHEDYAQLTMFPFFDGSRVVQQSNALHLSARGVTTDPGSIPGCVTTGHDQETHRAAHNWPSIVRVMGGFDRGRPSL
jgi:hypothetical protein